MLSLFGCPWASFHEQVPAAGVARGRMAQCMLPQPCTGIEVDDPTVIETTFLNRFRIKVNVMGELFNTRLWESTD